MATKKTGARAKAARPVLVTTQYGGVFFGYAADTRGDAIHLKRGRNCVFWSQDLKGFVGLAAHGPSDSCRIGPAADMELRGVTAIVEVTPEAATRWEAAPWGS